MLGRVFGSQGLGCRIQGSGFRVQGLGLGHILSSQCPSTSTPESHNILTFQNFLFFCRDSYLGRSARGPITFFFSIPPLRRGMDMGRRVLKRTLYSDFYIGNIIVHDQGTDF